MKILDHLPTTAEPAFLSISLFICRGLSVQAAAGCLVPAVPACYYQLWVRKSQEKPCSALTLSMLPRAVRDHGWPQLMVSPALWPGGPNRHQQKKKDTLDPKERPSSKLVWFISQDKLLSFTC